VGDFSVRGGISIKPMVSEFSWSVLENEGVTNQIYDLIAFYDVVKKGFQD
jgi:hypothetical protein